MTKTHIKPILLASTIALAGGCSTYQPLDISHDIMLNNVNAIYQQQNTILKAISQPAFADFAQIMSENNPELQVLKEQYKGAEDVASFWTPLPNPSLDIGQTKGSNLQDTVAKKVQPFIGLGFTIPLGGRLGKEDDLNAALAEQKKIDLISRHRSLYMELRQAYLSYLLSKEELQVCDSIVVTSEELDHSTRNLVSIGSLGRLDALDANFDLKDIELKLLEIRNQHIQLIQQFAALVGTTGANVKQASGLMPDMHNISLVADTKLFELIGLNNPDLVARKVEFSVADAKLKHELSKQYPDISFGAEKEQEPGEKTKFLSLSIGFEIPLFDRNQQGIAEAESSRIQLSKQYQGDVQNILTDLERLKQSFNNTRLQIATLDELVTISSQRLEAGRQSLSAGSIGMTRFLDMQKEHDILLIGQVDKKREFWQTVFELETTIGIPLISLPGESFSEDIFNYASQEELKAQAELDEQIELEEQENTNDK